jgi:hypothetical protein
VDTELLYKAVRFKIILFVCLFIATQAFFSAIWWLSPLPVAELQI